MRTTEPTVGKVTLSIYLSQNTRVIIQNWKHGFIREKYNYRMTRYITDKVDRIACIFHIPTNHPALLKLAGKLYRTL